LEFVRAPLEAGVERLCVPLLASGRLDQKSHDELFSALEQGAEHAASARDLVALYRRLIFGVERTLENATLARQDRGTQRGVEFMREHFAEAIGVGEAARAAGFAHDHFTRLFKRDEGTTPEAYLFGLRIEHAKRLLVESDLGMELVRVQSGFRTRTYFHRAFKRAVGVTPLAYRRHRKSASQGATHGAQRGKTGAGSADVAAP
jgi:transcriptional regulator GlxA family with amidase domain